MTTSSSAPTPSAIVFSDLDGTLLDHHSYGWDPARPMLARLAWMGIPVVLASSKTAAEMVPLRAAMGLAAAPLICENGAGVVASGANGLPGHEAYDRLRMILGTVPPALRHQFRGFGDLGEAGISAVTGLPPKDAALAATRAWSEPGVWDGSAEDETAFVAALGAHGVSARRGGRFLTLSFGGSKADRLAQIETQLGGAQQSRWAMRPMIWR